MLPISPVLKAFLMRQAERYDTLAAPIVVITGDRDTVVSQRHHAMRLAAAVPGARVEVLPGFGHMLHHAAADTGSSPRSWIALARRLDGANQVLFN